DVNGADFLRRGVEGNRHLVAFLGVVLKYQLRYVSAHGLFHGNILLLKSSLHQLGIRRDIHRKQALDLLHVLLHLVGFLLDDSLAQAAATSAFLLLLWRRSQWN